MRRREGGGGLIFNFFILLFNFVRGGEGRGGEGGEVGLPKPGESVARFMRKIYDAFHTQPHTTWSITT